MRNRPGIILLSLAGVILSAAARSPGAPSEGVDIRGVVTDSTNGERLPGVNVTVEGTGRGWVTNVNGFYLIAAVPRGRRSVTASAVGYRPRKLTVDIAGTEPITVNIQLAPRNIEASEVTIEGEREEDESRRSASIHVVTPHDLEQVPAAAEADLFRMMQILPGISSTSDVNSKFYVRGGASDQNLVLLDGMKLFNPFHAYGIFGVLDPDIIKSADIYTGAFPANYGDRLSSVVNVTTRDGNRSNFAGNAGINFLSASLGLEGPIGGDNSWLVNGRKSVFPGTLEKLFPSAAPTSFYDLFFKGTAGNSTGRVGIRGFINDDEITPTDPVQPGYSWKSASFAGVISGLITDRIYMDLTMGLSSSQVLRRASAASPVPEASSKISEWSFRGEFDVYPENQNHFAMGFESAFPNISNVLPTRAGTERTIEDSEGELWLWFRYSASLGSFGLDAGLHTELNAISGAALGNEAVPLRQILQPRITLSLNLDGNWIAKAAYGVFTQNIITINNEDDLISLFDAWVYLPDQLRPEEADHYVLGLAGNITPQLSTSIQAYVKDYKSL
ncbi:MAG TPA: TonB-dependent receptor, partial [Bacteroidota bacterium]|nr:TonB-dependent receptor [Bacteroidota bacterium]